VRAVFVNENSTTRNGKFVFIILTVTSFYIFHDRLDLQSKL